MSEYRHTETGIVMTQGQWRKHYSNTSLPRTWKAATLDALKLDAVLPGPEVTKTQYQNAVRDGVEQDANGNWVEKYVVQDMFKDMTGEDGVTTTKAQYEATYQAILDAELSEFNRIKRNKLLSETDYFALTDVTMDAAMTTYRQALRDITSHSNWPNLAEDDWPTAP